MAMTRQLMASLLELMLTAQQFTQGLGTLRNVGGKILLLHES
jgi:hypothetical protein